MKKDMTKCTLTDIELLEACHKAISQQCSKQKWLMSVPVDMNRDSDMLLVEVCNRYEKACKEPALGNATTDQLISELYARFDSFPNMRAIPFTTIMEDLRHKLVQEELQYKTNDQPLTMRNIPQDLANTEDSFEVSLVELPQTDMWYKVSNCFAGMDRENAIATLEELFTIAQIQK